MIQIHNLKISFEICHKKNGWESQTLMKSRQQWLSSRLSSSCLKSQRALHRAGGGCDWCCGSISDIWLTVCSVLAPAKGPLLSLLFLRCLSSSTLCFGLTLWPGIGTGSPDKSACWLRVEVLTSSWKKQIGRQGSIFADSWQTHRFRPPIHTWLTMQTGNPQENRHKGNLIKQYFYKFRMKSLFNDWLASNYWSVFFQIQGLIKYDADSADTHVSYILSLMSKEKQDTSL